MGNNKNHINGIQMKFTALAALIGATQAITLWTTTGQIAYFENDDEPEAMNVQLDDWHPGQHEMLGASAYERVIPARFETDDDDIFMRSMLKNYAIDKNCEEDEDKDPYPCGKFIMNESTMRAAASEVLCTHKGLCGGNLQSYLDTYFAKAWGHFDVNRTGEIEVIKSPQFMRFLASDQYMSLQ